MCLTCFSKDVFIGEYVEIDNAIVCDGVVIENNCRVPRGCVLSYGVVLKEGTSLDPFTRLSKKDESLTGIFSHSVADNVIAIIWCFIVEDGSHENLHNQLQSCSIGVSETWKRFDPIYFSPNHQSDDVFLMSSDHFGRQHQCLLMKIVTRRTKIFLNKVFLRSFLIWL
jgi:hypothetical protein